MMTGLRRCVAAAAAVLALAAVSSATVIEYEPTPANDRRGVTIDGSGDLTDDLGAWSGLVVDGSRFAAQDSNLGQTQITATYEVSGSGAASFLDVRFTLADTVPFKLNASTTAAGAVVILRDLTTQTNLVLFTPFSASSQSFQGQLTGGHEFSLVSTLQDPFGASPTASMGFTIPAVGGPITPIPAPAACTTLAAAGLMAGTRRRR